MNKKILILIASVTFNFLALSLVVGQEYITWTKDDSLNLQIVEQAFANVISLDGDSSVLARWQRADVADQLWQYYLENLKSKSGERALFNSFASSLRNLDYHKIIDRYQQLSINGQFWRSIYLFYRKSLWKSKSRPESIIAFTQELDKLNGPLQISQIHYDIGFTAHKSCDLALAQRHYEKFLEISTDLNGFEKERMRAESELHAIAALDIGHKMPDFTAVDIDAKPVRSSDYLGKVMIVHFWATWCKPCRKEHPKLQKLIERYSSDQLQIIGISLDKNIASLREYIEQKDISWPQVHASAGRNDRLVRLINGMSLPTYYVVDREGIIRFNFHSRERGEDFVTAVEDLVDSRN